MSVIFPCSSCGTRLRAPDKSSGKRTKCPKCSAVCTVPVANQPAPAPATVQEDEYIVEVISNGTPWWAPPPPVVKEGENRQDTPVYPSPAHLHRILTFLRLRQRIRALCDRFGLGPSMGERFCTVLIVAVIPFVLCMGISVALQDPAQDAVLRGVGAFVFVLVSFSILLGVASDEKLAERLAQLMRDLPLAEKAWEEKKARERAERERARLEKEGGQLEIVGEAAAGSPIPVPEQSQQPARSEASAGVAAILESGCGILQIFGIGHLYAGRILFGLLMMFGYWLFLAGNLLGIWMALGPWEGFVFYVTLPAGWFLMMIVSPILAVNEATHPRR